MAVMHGPASRLQPLRPRTVRIVGVDFLLVVGPIALALVLGATLILVS